MFLALIVVYEDMLFPVNLFKTRVRNVTPLAFPILCLLGCGSSGGFVAINPEPISAPNFLAEITTEDVIPHIETLALGIGRRPMGSAEEVAAANYIAAELGSYGYEIEYQTFQTNPPDTDDIVTSLNVIATKPGNSEILVIGAHMDSVPEAGEGAGDNATGIAAILAAAEILAPVETTRTVVFIAFGAEEGGDPSGADTYVASLGSGISNVVAMFNLDTVGMGTDLNVYAGAVVEKLGDTLDNPSIFEPGPRWVLDLSLDLAGDLNLPFQTTPPQTWGGYTGPWSDHYAFVTAGVPILYFETWGWGLDLEAPWFGQQTAAGDFLHTENDLYTNVDPVQVEQMAELAAATAYTIMIGDEPGNRVQAASSTSSGLELLTSPAGSDPEWRRRR